MAGFACRHCGAKSGHANIKRKPRGDLDKEIINILTALSQNGCQNVMKEALAVQLNVAVKYVEQSLHRLNLKGFISQPEHRAPHDSTRDPWSGTDSAWMGDIYYLRHDKLRDLRGNS